MRKNSFKKRIKKWLLIFLYVVHFSLFSAKCQDFQLLINVVIDCVSINPRKKKVLVSGEK